MDLVANVKRIVIVMEHTIKDNKAKLLKKCTLPLTGINVVNRIITDLGVFNIARNSNIFNKKPEYVSIKEIKAKTLANINILL